MKREFTVSLLLGIVTTLSCFKSQSPVLTPARDQQRVIVLERARKVAQLVGEVDRERGEPTLNRTESRYKIFGTDLGVSFRHKERTYLLFGDTVGASACPAASEGGDATSTTIYFTMSTWNPYTIVLMKATLRKAP